MYSAAEIILTKCNSICILGKGWAVQFIKQYPQYWTRKTVPLAAVKKAVHKTEVIETYFEKFRVMVAEKGIHKDDIYNFDEIGFRIGCTRGVLVITHSTKSWVYTIDSNNQKLITIVEYISTGGFAIKLMLIISSKMYLEKAFNNNLYDKILISLSDIEYLNKVLDMY